jgi:hypothetical protein
MLIYLLGRIRKLLKSIGKKEKTLVHLINYQKFKKKRSNYVINNEIVDLYKESNERIKIAAVITFFFNKDKIFDLTKVCKGLSDISDQNEIHIFTNNISPNQAKKLKEEIKVKVNLIIIDEPINDRMLPWYHLNLMKKLFVVEDITHFLYLEDDILLDKSNFKYWVNSRKILKEFGLIPGFIRIENNKSDKQLYAIDFLKKSKLNLLPKIKVNKDYYFINNEFPYQGMYLYDRELMKEHLFGPSSNPDCGHGAFDSNFLDERMINQDLMAKANIGLTYINPPYGFFNRIVIPFDTKKKRIDPICEIQHLSNRYANTYSSFGNIKVEDIIQ